MEKNIELTTMSLLLYSMRSMSGWLGSSMKDGDRIYLKGMFQLEASSWLIENLDGCWHNTHNQSKNNSQKKLGDKILHDESSNTTLGGIVKLDKQREQYSSWTSPGWVLHLQLSGWLAHEWASTLKEQRRVWNANKGTLRWWNIKKGGTYISNQVNMYACHLTSKHYTYLWFVTERSSMKSIKIVDKERIIELMITKNRFRSWNKKRMRWTLSVGES